MTNNSFIFWDIIHVFLDVRCKVVQIVQFHLITDKYTDFQGKNRWLYSSSISRSVNRSLQMLITINMNQYFYVPEGDIRPIVDFYTTARRNTDSFHWRLWFENYLIEFWKSCSISSIEPATAKWSRPQCESCCLTLSQ